MSAAASEAPTRPRRRALWGWGYGEEQARNEDRAALTAGLRAHLGFEPASPELPRPVEALDLRLVAPESSARAGQDLLIGSSRAGPARLRPLLPRHDPGLSRPLRPPARRSGLPARRSGGLRAARVVRRRRRRGDPLRRRHERRWRRRARRGRGLRGGGLDRHAAARPRARGGSHLARRPHPGGRDRAGARGPAPRPRSDAPSLPPVVRAVDPRGLDRHAGGRALRHRTTHVDELVESIRAITPRGEWESRRLPGSGAGPSPDRLLLGSEGALGIITEAWMRVRPRPRYRARANVRFATFGDGAGAVRALTQSGLEPSNCRLLDPREAALTGAAADGEALLVLGFESAGHPLGAWIERGVELCDECGGRMPEPPRLTGPEAGTGGGEQGRTGEGGEDGGSAWRSAFLRAPYLRDDQVVAGVISETFETAITWDRFDAFVAEVRERAAAAAAVREACGEGTITCRLTHAYPDGAAPYFTVLAPARRGSELEQWDGIKAAASEAVLAAGGTITHHHAVGRDHRAWYDRQRPEPFAGGLRAAKRELDPDAILNPGVLVDPGRREPVSPA